MGKVYLKPSTQFDLCSTNLFFNKQKKDVDRPLQLNALFLFRHTDPSYSRPSIHTTSTTATSRLSSRTMRQIFKVNPAFANTQDLLALY